MSKLYKVFYRNQKSLVHRLQSAERFWQQDLCELSCILCADDTFLQRSLSLSYAQFPLEQSLSCSPSNFARCHLRNTLHSICQCLYWMNWMRRNNTCHNARNIRRCSCSQKQHWNEVSECNRIQSTVPKFIWGRIVIINCASARKSSYSFSVILSTC